jgi:hypothetical protein
MPEEEEGEVEEEEEEEEEEDENKTIYFHPTPINYNDSLRRKI